jgi:hypothetical protein
VTPADTAKLLRRLNACPEAREWAKGRTLRACWDESPRGDWLLWLAGRLEIDRPTLVLAACACARTALRYVPAGDDRPRAAIETAEAWCRGEATLDQAQEAGARAAAGATWAAAEAAEAAEAGAAAARAAWAAAEAAWAAAGAAGAAAEAEAARVAAHAEHARLVRGIIPWDQIEAAAEVKL